MRSSLYKLASMFCMYNRFELSGKGTYGNETEISDSTGTPKASTNNQTTSFDSTVPSTNVTSSNVNKVVSSTTGPGIIIYKFCII